MSARSPKSSPAIKTIFSSHDEFISALQNTFSKKITDDKKNLKKICVIGNVTTKPIADILKIVFHREKIAAEIFEFEYEALEFELLNKNNRVQKLNPDIVYIAVSAYKIKNFPCIGSLETKIKKFLNQEIHEWKKKWQNLNAESRIVIQENFTCPECYELEKISAKYSWTPKKYIQKINEEFWKFENGNFRIMDMASLSEKHGSSFSEPKWYFHGKLNFNPAFSFSVANQITGLIQDIFGQNKKCLILDLDNVLWGGELGDIGYEALEIGEESPNAQAFKAFQGYLQRLSKTGLMLAVCSKNNEKSVKLAFEKNKNFVLRKNDFVAMKCNWEAKSKNILSIAKELNILTDSIVFADDNIFEIQEVAKNLPEVTCVHLKDDPSRFCKIINDLNIFLPTMLTKEDIQRNASISSKPAVYRKINETDSVSFLKSLKMKSKLQPLNLKNIDRIRNLFAKTNQFNFNKKVFSQSEYKKAMEKNSEIKCLIFDFCDKNMFYGIVSALMIRINAGTLEILNWVLSCRVFSRTLEHKIYNYLIKIAEQKRINQISFEILANEKNTYLQMFLERALHIQLIQGVTKYKIKNFKHLDFFVR